MDHRHHWIWSPGHTACLFIHIYMYKYIRTDMVAYVLCTNQHWFGCRLEYVFLRIIHISSHYFSCMLSSRISCSSLSSRSISNCRSRCSSSLIRSAIARSLSISGGVINASPSPGLRWPKARYLGGCVFVNGSPKLA